VILKPFAGIANFKAFCRHFNFKSNASFRVHQNTLFSFRKLKLFSGEGARPPPQAPLQREGPEEEAPRPAHLRRSTLAPFKSRYATSHCVCLSITGIGYLGPNAQKMKTVHYLMDAQLLPRNMRSAYNNVLRPRVCLSVPSQADVLSKWLNGSNWHHRRSHCARRGCPETAKSSDVAVRHAQLFGSSI